MPKTRRNIVAASLIVVALLALIGTPLWGGIPAVERWFQGVLGREERPHDPAADAPGVRPKAVVEEVVHFFGSLDPGARCAHTFIIRNQGTAPLELDRGPTSCKCTMSDLPSLSVPPGGQVAVEVASKLDRQPPGEFVHTATILTNDPEQPTITLRLEGMVRRLIGASPERIVLSGLRRDQEHTKSVTIYSQVWQQFRIENLSSSLPGVTWELIGQAGKEQLEKLDALSGWQLHVNLPAGLPAGNFWGELAMDVVPQVPEAEPKRFVLEIAGTVLARITLSGPQMDSKKGVVLGVLEAGVSRSARLILKVRDEHRQLQVQQIDIEPPFLKVTVAPVQPRGEQLGLYTVDLEVPADAPMCDYLSKPGKVTILTDHPAVPAVDFAVRFAVAGRQSP